MSSRVLPRPSKRGSVFQWKGEPVTALDTTAERNVDGYGVPMIEWARSHVSTEGAQR